jgi:hypothetical protein
MRVVRHARESARRGAVSNAAVIQTAHNAIEHAGSASRALESSGEVQDWKSPARRELSTFVGLWTGG